MKFVVTRTSDWNDNKVPCAKAKREIITNNKSGEDYRERNVWTIELNTLEELINFTNKYGRIVIEEYWLNDKFKEIEIYDGYRE
jgi:hypothetical protein